MGNWRLTHQICSGKLTHTYLAQPEGTPADRPADYAIKVLRSPHDVDPLAIDLIRREADIGQQISHPHLVPILDAHGGITSLFHRHASHWRRIIAAVD